MNDKLVTLLTKQINRADREMKQRLTKLAPVGSRVTCTIQSGQVNPSHGVVSYVEGGPYAYLKVRLESRTNEVRSVPLSNIVSILKPSQF